MFNSHQKSTNTQQNESSPADKAKVSDITNKFAKLGSLSSTNPFASMVADSKPALSKMNNSNEETKESRSSIQSKFNFATYLEPGSQMSQQAAATSS